jgi:hypothetical protein
MYQQTHTHNCPYIPVLRLCDCQECPQSPPLDTRLFTGPLPPSLSLPLPLRPAATAAILTVAALTVDALQAHTLARVPLLAWGRFVPREPTGRPVRRRQRLQPVSTAPQVGSLPLWLRVLRDPYWHLHLYASIHHGCLSFTLCAHVGIPVHRAE